MSEYVLLTGSTGLLGRYLIRDLLLAGKRLAVLARPSRKETAAERVEAIMQMWEEEVGQLLPRPVCLEGDICSEGLGLDTASRDWVSKHCSTMLHSAASLTFHEDGTGEPYRSNVGGTQNMLELCRDTGISDLHFVSTAYVCGLRTDLARENELDVGQGFRNAYEETKLQAEKMVREADFIDQLTVYRPAVISGDSKTGYTNTYHGLYLYLRLMSILVPQQELDENGQRHTPIRAPGTGNEARNIVPIDWVSEVMTHLIQTPEAHGQTFNLAPESPLTPRELIEAGYSYFNSTGVQFVGDAEVDPTTYTRFEAEFLPNMSMYENYEVTDPTFDCTNLRKFAGHLPCPVIDEEVIHQYIRFGEQDRWGKRRSRHASVDFSKLEGLQEFVDQVNTTAHSRNGHAPEVVGLDIVGPSGGQLTIEIYEAEIVGLSQGLSAKCRTILEVPSQTFANAVKGGVDGVLKYVQVRLGDEQFRLSSAFREGPPEVTRADVHASSTE